MTKPADTHEHPSREPKKSGCCGESHAKDEKAQPAAQEQANPPQRRQARAYASRGQQLVLLRKREDGQ